MATASIPTSQAVFTAADVSLIRGRNTYRRSADRVGRLLIEMGAISRMRSPMQSDLPFEFGLASSTALALAHLGSRAGAVVANAVSETDAATNGFQPTGADYAAVSNGESGIFGTGGWFPLSFQLPPGSHLVLPSPERMRNKVASTQAMRADAVQLGALIDRLVSDLDDFGELNLDALHTYARRLVEIGVYSTSQRSIIQALLADGIVAKGVGSMYDRAILVLADPEIWSGHPPGEVLRQSA